MTTENTLSVNEMIANMANQIQAQNAAMANLLASLQPAATQATQAVIQPTPVVVAQPEQPAATQTAKRGRPKSVKPEIVQVAQPAAIEPTKPIAQPAAQTFKPNSAVSGNVPVKTFQPTPVAKTDLMTFRAEKAVKAAASNILPSNGTIESVSVGELTLQHDKSTRTLAIICNKKQYRVNENGNKVFGSSGKTQIATFESGLTVKFNFSAYTVKTYIPKQSGYVPSNIQFEQKGDSLIWTISLTMTMGQTDFGHRIANSHGNQGIKLDSQTTVCYNTWLDMAIAEYQPSQVETIVQPAATKPAASSKPTQPAAIVANQPSQENSAIADSLRLYTMYKKHCADNGDIPSKEDFQVWYEIAKELGAI